MGLPCGDRRPGVAAVERQLLLERRAGELQQRRIPVDHVQRLVDDGARLDVAVPGGERGDAHAALVERPLAGPQRAVASRPLQRAAVVAGEDEQRVVPHARFCRSPRRSGRPPRPSPPTIAGVVLPLGSLRCSRSGSRYFSGACSGAWTALNGTYRNSGFGRCRAARSAARPRRRSGASCSPRRGRPCRRGASRSRRRGSWVK